MQKRQLGLSGLEVSAIGLGCMAMSEFYGARDEREAIATIHRAIELGVDLIDTADIYGLGRNEEFVSRAMRRRRDRVVLSSKFGHVRGPDGRFLGVNGRPDYAKASCEASLRRLKVETIDLYICTASTRTRRSRTRSAPWPSSSGKRRSAISGFRRRRRQAFGGLTPCIPSPCCRPNTRCSLASQRATSSRSVHTFGIGFVAYSPLGRGLLSGRLKNLGKLGPDD